MLLSQSESDIIALSNSWSSPGEAGVYDGDGETGEQNDKDGEEIGVTDCDSGIGILLASNFAFSTSCWCCSIILFKHLPCS